MFSLKVLTQYNSETDFNTIHTSEAGQSLALLERKTVHIRNYWHIVCLCFKEYPSDLLHLKCTDCRGGFHKEENTAYLFSYFHREVTGLTWYMP